MYKKVDRNMILTNTILLYCQKHKLTGKFFKSIKGYLIVMITWNIGLILNWVLQDLFILTSNPGEWDDTFKYKTHPYACDYQGKYILSATMKTWSGAKKACEAAGLMLAKVELKNYVSFTVVCHRTYLSPSVFPVQDSERWYPSLYCDENEIC